MMNLALVLVMAAAPTPSGCGWVGVEVASPDVVVRGADVRLGEPLRIVRVAEGSPAAIASLAPGMAVLAIDGDAWDDGRFLTTLVRLHTVAPGNSLKLVIRDGESERTVRVRAAECTPEQSKERARVRARLGWMEGTAWAHGPRRSLDALTEAERDAVRRARREYARAIRDAERQMSDPEVQRRVEEAIRGAAEANRLLALRMNDPELRARIRQAAEDVEAARRSLEESGDDPDLRRRLEELEREAGEARRLFQGRLQDADLRRGFEDAMRAAEEARRHFAEAWDRETLERTMPELQAHMAEMQDSLADPEAMAEARRQLDRAREQMERNRAILEDAHRLEADRIKAAVRRALEQAEHGRYQQQWAISRALEAAERAHHAAGYFEGAEFQAVGRALAPYLGVDHGLLVSELDPGSALAEAGVKEGDILVAVDGTRVEAMGDLFEAITARADELAAAGELRGGVELEVHDRAGRRTVSLPVRVGDARDPI